MYKPEREAIVWRKHVMPYMKLDTGYTEEEVLASDRHAEILPNRAQDAQRRQTLVVRSSG